MATVTLFEERCVTTLKTAVWQTKLQLMGSFDWPVTSFSQPNEREERVTKPENYASEAIISRE